jgi:hypothetical protein
MCVCCRVWAHEYALLIGSRLPSMRSAPHFAANFHSKTACAFQVATARERWEPQSRSQINVILGCTSFYLLNHWLSAHRRAFNGNERALLRNYTYSRWMILVVSGVKIVISVRAYTVGWWWIRFIAPNESVLVYWCWYFIFAHWKL